MDTPLFSSGRRLCAPRHFDRLLIRFLKQFSACEEKDHPAGRLLAREAPFLHARYHSLKKDLHYAPALPAVFSVPRILLAAREMIRILPLHPGRMMHAFRTFFGDAEPLCREMDQMEQALCCALMEQVKKEMEKVLQPADEEEKLRGRETCALLMQALHTLPRLPLNTLRDHLSPVVQILGKEETFRLMDRESRRYYEDRVCHLARKWHLAETAVARAALTLTEGKEGAEKEAGYYLIEQPEQIAAYLFKSIPCPTLRRKTFRFLLPMTASGVFFAVVYLLLQAPVFLLPFALLSLSEHVRCVYYRLLRRLYPPRMLPRIHKKHLPKQPLLVVIPALLTHQKQALQMAHQLQTLHAATPHAHFMLLGDFADSPDEMTPEDQEILRTAAAAIDALNRQEKGTFLYLQRQRSWDEGQQHFSGRERKRGALEDLNLLLTGQECKDVFLYASIPLPHLKDAYDTVITLDADTFLPPGAAAKLQGALAHPLQKGRIHVIQPRMATLARDIRTRTQALLTFPGSVDSYHSFVQNVYQDVFGRGSFAGKGIYHPAAFLAATKDALPKGRILSHDLIEGELAGAAMAEDIVLFDAPPARISGWQKRLHRWTRGDWQLLPFLKDRSLPLLSRWKIYDNLRSSLVPVSEMLLMLLGALLQNPFLMLLGLPYPFRGLWKRLLTLPGKALTQLDAAVRAIWRLYVSKKNLLSWVTASQAESSTGLSLSCTAALLLSGLWMLVFSLLEGGVLPGLIPGAMWLVAPLMVSFMDRPIRTLPALTQSEKESVLSLCRDTWRFFEKQVHSRTFFLPPDNVQLQPEKGPALRTSPTNIGLYLLSALAARELNLITAPQMARRMANTMDTLEKMEKWQGHFYNWYDLNDLSPLPPLFVSTVDSGNLCACLLACAQGLRAHLTEIGDAFHALPERMDRIAGAMRFDRLYDPSVSLFRIGYDTEKCTPTPSHYDLLASECRLASFVAVMQRQVPLKHWFSLGRSLTRQAGGAALLSWSGTAFEYLMPALLLPLYPGTLLRESCLNAIRSQISHAQNRPFGISESGYYTFDPDMNYQYRAFGLPSLALSGHSKGQVVAPYASMLALPFFPQAAIRNLQWMRRLSWFSEEGLYEAADYTPAPLEKTPRLVESHMAHHQGMILCAACNLLSHFSLVQYFMAPAPARAYAFLLCEGKPPLPPLFPSLPQLKESLPPKQQFSLPAHPGMAHALCGKDVTWLVDSKGNGLIKSKNRLWTRFFPEDMCGPQFYLRQSQTGAVIRPQAQQQMLFENGCIRMPIRAFHLQGDMRFFVLPLNGHAVMELQLENRHTLDVPLEVISFLETARTAYREDIAHPAFRDLSVLIEPYQQDGLVCHALSQTPVPLLMHRVLGPVQSLQRQGDRLLFLGRRGSYTCPEQVVTPADRCAFRTGATLAPCLSLRAHVLIRPGEKIRLQFVTAEYDLAADIPQSDALLSPAALALCHEKAAMTLRFLQIRREALPMYLQMQGMLCFARPNVPARTETAPLSCLWRYGLSGKEPLCTVYLHAADKPLIRHALLAHGMMETNGVKTALLFLCDEGNEAYLTPVQDAVRAAMDSLKGSRGAIVLAKGSKADAENLKSLSRVYLESGMPLADQLLSYEESEEDSLPLAPPAPLPPPLRYANPCGGFTEEGDYCLFAMPPAPWHNLLAGQHFGTLVCENAILHSFCDNSHLNRITKKATDVHRPEGAERYTLTDEQNTCFSLTGGLVFHRPGVTEYHSLPFGVSVQLTVCSHPSLSGGLRLITLQGETDGVYTLSCRLHFPSFSALQTHAEEKMVLVQNALRPGCAVMAMPAADSVECRRNTVLFRCRIALKKHRKVSLPLYIGFARQEEEAVCLAAALLQQGPAGCLQAVRSFWQQKLENLMLFSGNPWLELYMNRWLPYQTLSARLLGRTGPYQDGGAIGFRDQLQDMLCCLHTAPAMVREHLLLCAAHQFPEGDVQHWWHPPRTGVRTRISDDKLFLPFITALYVQITEDRDVLEEQAPFLLSPPLKAEEHDRYETPDVSLHTASLMDHCLLAMESVSFSPRGIPLMGSGDWNDGMNRVDGESVWLGFFLCVVYQQFAPLCEPAVARKLMQKRSMLLQALEAAWTGKWYLRAWYKNGDAMGSPHTQPPRIDLISQAFACLAGAPREQVRTALGYALERLYDKNNGLVQLLDPPFTPLENAGYIGQYVPGVRENGGQYTHAVPWLIMALAQIGRWEEARQIARDMLPLFHTDTPEKLHIYRKEPYVLCGDVYAGENRGRGGWSWYTGSAAWLYYVYLTCILGFEKRGNKVRLNPLPCADAEEFTLVWRCSGTTWHLTASPETRFATLDGEKLKDGWAPLVSDGRTHEAHFPYRKG